MLEKGFYDILGKITVYQSSPVTKLWESAILDRVDLHTCKLNYGFLLPYSLKQSAPQTWLTIKI